jgi:PKD repeat protein
MKIALPGTIQITMHSEPAYDIDFCCWGPFDNQNACGQLTSNKVVDCSYSTAATEVVDIPNAQTAKYYILVITNFSNQPCNIIFSKTGGAGTTDCTILPPAATNNSPLCIGESLHLNAATMNNAIYHWLGPDGWTSNVQNPIRPNAQLSMAGIYKLWVTVNGQPSADTNLTTVAIHPKPTASLRGSETICQGDSTALTITCQNQPPWTVTVSATGQLPMNIPIIVSPYYFYVNPSTTTTYTLTAVSNEICTGVAGGSATVTVNPKPVVNFNFDNLCSGYATQFTDITTVAGGYATAWLWNFGNNNDTSNIQNPVYTYMTGGQYNVNLQVTSDNGCTGQITKEVAINPTPVAYAGNDKSIPYGTNTSLQGSASGGTGSYTFHWEPANLLTNPNIQNPSTVNLTQTTDFVLTVTDQGNACQKSDIITVTITGGPLGVQLSATPEAICKGDATTINTQAGGGSGNYTYSWSSNPPGFSSTLEDITVQPTVTTQYMLLISDGFTNQSKSITITVYPDPIVDAGVPQSIPNGTYTLLSGSATSSAQPIIYAWSPSDKVTNPSNPNTNTTILSTTTNFTLTATDAHGCISSDDILITITGGALAVDPIAVQSPICFGESTMLHPLSEGGSGDYSYSWTSPGGFTSSVSDPVVFPTQTTTYTVVVDDGFTQTRDSVTVTVNPLPILHLMPAGAHSISPDTMLACAFDTITLSAANPSAEYLWSNGATTPEIQLVTTGLAFDQRSYSVEVNNTLTGCHNSGNLTIMFTFSECSYGKEELKDEQATFIYPNPGNGIFRIRLSPNATNIELAVHNSLGMSLMSRLLCRSNGDEFILDLSAYPNGVYYVIGKWNNFRQVTRLIKY